MSFPEMQNDEEGEFEHVKANYLNNPYQREMACFFVPDHDLLSITTNNYTGGVAFDFFTIWEKLKTIDTPVVYMMHSHPPGCVNMSTTDANMVFGWCQALKQPILFLIVTINDEFGLTLTAYLCEKSKEDRNKVKRELVDVEISMSVRRLMDLMWYLSTYPQKIECDTGGKSDFSDVLKGEFPDLRIEWTPKDEE